MSKQEVASPLVTSRIVWAALSFSTLVYGFILLTTGKSIFFKVPESYSLLETIALILNLILIITFNIHEKRVKPETSMARRFPWYVICWALHETMVVVAFVAVITAENSNLFIYSVNLLLALFGNVMTFPREPAKMSKP